jgi:tetratricopeptide (TPR) repeat protein
MDCLRALGAAVICIGMVSGCGLPMWPSASGPGAAKLPDTVPPHPDELEAEHPKELKPATLVAYATLKERSAMDAEQSQADREGLREAARQAYLRALEMDSKYIPAHIGLANWYDANGNHAKALATYQQAAKLAPKDKGLLFQLGMCHARHKDWEPAIDNLRKAHELDPDNRQCAKTLGLCLARAGRYDESLATLEKVEGKAEAQCTVARMLHHMNQDEASRQQAELALQSNPNLAQAHELLEELEGSSPTASAEQR